MRCEGAPVGLLLFSQRSRGHGSQLRVGTGRRCGQFQKRESVKLSLWRVGGRTSKGDTPSVWNGAHVHQPLCAVCFEGNRFKRRLKRAL